MELRNVEADLSRFRTRIFVFTVLVLACFFLLLCRLVYLQFNQTDPDVIAREFDVQVPGSIILHRPCSLIC